MKNSLRFVTGLLALALTAGAAQAQANGGFESGLTGWTATPAASTTIISSPDGGFPTQGNQFAQVLGNTGDFGTPSYGPHLAGSAAGQVAMLSRTFARPVGDNCEIQFDWKFIHREIPLGTFNDFLSIDVIDVATNTLVQNVVFCDNGELAGTPSYNGVPGANGGLIAFVDAVSGVFTGSDFEPAPAGMKRARADLGFIAPGTMLRLDIAVANEGDSVAPSAVYIDNFKVLSGGRNDFRGALRVLGAGHADGNQTGFDSGGDTQINGPIDFPVMPGQKIAVRASATQGGLGWALLVGDVRNDGSDFGFDEFNLSVAAGINVVVDGLNPVTPVDVILGTLGFQSTFLEGALPIDVPDGDVGLTAVMEDPTAGPLFIEGTATTRLQIRSAISIPKGDTEVLDAGGSSLSDDDFGLVDLSPIGGFDFYGVNYTECFVSSNGCVTFGSGDTDFSDSAVEMYTDARPRIAVCWDDFSPPLTPGVEVESRVASGGGAITISWTNLARFSDSVGGNNFSVQLFNNGTIVCYYGSLTTDLGTFGITPGGLTAPTGAVFSTIDLSSGSAHNGNDFNFSDTQPAFEHFNVGSTTQGTADRCDVMTLGVNGPSRICYVPDGVGYRVFTGVR